MMSCASCGEMNAERASFCQFCGRSLLRSVVGLSVATAPSPVPPSPVTPKPAARTDFSYGDAKPERSRLLVIVSAGLALALVVAGVFVDLQVRNKLHRTETQLAATQETLTQTKSSLASTQTTLDSTEQKLTDTETERDQLQTALQGVRGSLNQAQGRLELQAGQIDTLRTCLTGVATALDDVLRVDYAGAVGALQSVQIPCQSAFQLI